MHSDLPFRFSIVLAINITFETLDPYVDFLIHLLPIGDFMQKYTCAISTVLLVLIAAPAFAQDYVITIKDHKFSPPELVIPAGQKVKITVKNADATDEFESSDLDREKSVDANSEIAVFVGPLKAGSYKYFGDEHRDTANGIITAK